MRPHKEPVGITFESGSMRTVSGSEGCELKAHLACGRSEAFEALVLVGFFLGGKDAQIERDPMSEQMPDNSGQFVGHGGNGFGSTEFGAQAPVSVSQIAFFMMQSGGSYAQGLPKPVLAATGRAAQHFA